MRIVDTLIMIEKLRKDRTKSFKMVNYDDLLDEYGRQILGRFVVNFGGKICYQTDGFPTVKLSYCLLELSKWEEVE